LRVWRKRGGFYEKELNGDRNERFRDQGKSLEHLLFSYKIESIELKMYYL
jgi:hypothetical protein